MIPKSGNILVFNDHFYPGFRAGGPIQSLVNLVRSLQHVYNFFIVTSAWDLNSNKAYDVKLNNWNDIMLPLSHKPVNVWYGTKKSPTASDLNNIIAHARPDMVYLNGIFSLKFFLRPLAFLQSHKNIRIVVCPRGMLQRGALSGKKIKKILYLHFLKYSGFLKHTYWHATGVDERQDIQGHFRHAKIYIAPNIPTKPLDDAKPSEKKDGVLRLIYLSLITEKKNLHLVLESLKQTDNIILDIYGPIKDKAYWDICLRLMKDIHHIVQYQGDVEPAKVQETIINYDAAILLTKGENFGHAIYESLSVGRPVIISQFTPWQNLAEQKAGWNIDLDKENVTAMLENIKNIANAEHEEFCRGAHQLALNYYKNLNVHESYHQLF